MSEFVIFIFKVNINDLVIILIDFLWIVDYFVGILINKDRLCNFCVLYLYFIIVFWKGNKYIEINIFVYVLLELL